MLYTRLYSNFSQQLFSFYQILSGFSIWFCSHRILDGAHLSVQCQQSLLQVLGLVHLISNFTVFTHNSTLWRISPHKYKNVFNASLPPPWVWCNVGAMCPNSIQLVSFDLLNILINPFNLLRGSDSLLMSFILFVHQIADGSKIIKLRAPRRRKAQLLLLLSQPKGDDPAVHRKQENSFETDR